MSIARIGDGYFNRHSESLAILAAALTRLGGRPAAGGSWSRWLQQGQWLDAALRGVPESTLEGWPFPYQGDIARDADRLRPHVGNFVQCLRSAGSRSVDISDSWRRVISFFARALQLFPNHEDDRQRTLNPLIEDMRAAVLQFNLPPHRSTDLPDIRNRFTFGARETAGGRSIHKWISGRWGIPKKVFSFRKDSPGSERYRRTTHSQGTGDAAGHMIGDQFGGPTDTRDSLLGSRNVSLQHLRSNSRGTWQDFEDVVATGLKRGRGFALKVSDIFIAADVPTDPTGIARPIARTVEGSVFHPDGRSESIEQWYGPVTWGNFPPGVL